MSQTHLSEAVAARRARLAAHWGLSDEIVLIHAGSQIHRPGGQDQCFPFRVHPHFRWLTGLSVRDAVLAFDPQAGWTEFFPAVGPLDKVWEGLEPVGRGEPLQSLASFLEKRRGRPVVALGAGHDAPGSEIGRALEQKTLEARRPKDADELELLRDAVRATAAGFAMARALLDEGLTERVLQLELESAMLHAGADTMGYDTIVGFGPTSAIFHAAPGSRVLVPGEQVLVDAGAEVEGYVADVTRTYPGPGGWTAAQRDVYDILDAVERDACQQCRPGVEWHEIHTGAAWGIADGLRSLGILRCDPDEAVDTEAVALFFPHGVGHLLGLGVRDASGVGPGRGEKRRCCGVTPRCDLVLEPGFVATVEPGIYFIPVLLNDPALRTRFASQVDWTHLDAWMTPGGFRIEDDILVTDGAPVNLTAEIAH